MEYVSIPWGNHQASSDGHDVKHWTINLALFFMLILAGNEHELDWTYDDLLNEEIRRRDDKPPQLDTADDLTADTEVGIEAVAEAEGTGTARILRTRRKRPTTQDRGRAATEEPGTLHKQAVRSSARLKQKASNRTRRDEEEGGSQSRPTGKRQRVQSGPEVESSRAKKKSKPSGDGYYHHSFTGNIGELHDSFSQVCMFPNRFEDGHALRMSCFSSIMLKVLTT